MKKPTRTARGAALLALRNTIEQQWFLDAALDQTLGNMADIRERALARELAYGVCRFWPRLSAWREQLLTRPLKEKDHDVGVLINLGLYQLEYSRIPAHAAVAETVQLATSALRKRWANALVNAVLRRFIREREQCIADADKQLPARHAHPQWLIERFRDAWPEQWQDILEANNTHANMALRVNARRLTRDAAITKLASHAIGASPTRWCEQGLVLQEPRDVSALPGFADGDFSVQDQAAQLAAGLLSAQPGQRLLDACAAPGGKFAHVLETSPALSFALALDKESSRVRRIQQTLQRLNLKAQVRHIDALDVDTWWDGEKFDRILIDAPCSATGVIRRHPDIKLHRTPQDIDNLAQQQMALLTAMWPLLADGGRLLYATCSVLPIENANLIRKFLDARPDATPVEMNMHCGIDTNPGRQILPGEDGMDGFYYALLGKQ